MEVLFCRICSKTVDHRRKASLKRHLATSLRQEELDETGNNIQGFNLVSGMQQVSSVELYKLAQIWLVSGIFHFSGANIFSIQQYPHG